jgi:hypothetical protein
MIIKIYSCIYNCCKYINSLIFPKEQYIYKYDNGKIIDYTWWYYLSLLLNYTNILNIINVTRKYNFLIVTLSKNNIKNYYLKKDITINQLINNRNYNIVSKSRKPIRIYINGEEDIDIVNKIRNIDNNTLLKDILQFSNHNIIEYIEIKYINKYVKLLMKDIKDLAIIDIFDIIKKSEK